MIEFHKACTGCGACANVCPAEAITMQEDENGFLYPSINKLECVNCGLCQQVCVYKRNIDSFFNKPGTCYAVWAKDELRVNSSSGGVFSGLALAVLMAGGYVCGAAFTEKQEVHHIIIHDLKDIFRLQKSKYVQSYIDYIYKDIIELLNKGEQVLFAGTPCQVLGLKAFLKQKYSNLICIDILCHGVPSQREFLRYLAEEWSDVNIKSINFRDKCIGWTYNLQLSVEGDKGISICSSGESSFYRAFLARINLRNSCYECVFARPERVGDITIGDFWEIWTYNKKLDDRKGTSLVLTNTQEGQELFASIKKHLQMFEEVPFKQAQKGNLVLVHPLAMDKDRNGYFNDLKTMTISEAANKHLGDKIG